MNNVLMMNTTIWELIEMDRERGDVSSSGRYGVIPYSFPGKQGNVGLNRTRIGFSDLSGLPMFLGWL